MGDYDGQKAVLLLSLDRCSASNMITFVNQSARGLSLAMLCALRVQNMNAWQNPAAPDIHK